VTTRVGPVRRSRLIWACSPVYRDVTLRIPLSDGLQSMFTLFYRWTVITVYGRFLVQPHACT
jgi:hypothetical protein